MSNCGRRASRPAGRARSDAGPYKANLGPHAIYKGGALWAWLSKRNLMPPLARPQLTGVRFHYDGAIHRPPPLSLIPRGLRLRGRVAPSDQEFRSWVADHSDERTAAMLSGLAGVYTFHHDPGELSAAFVWERAQRLCLDLALHRRRDDPWVISDLSGAGWIERYSANDPSLAPAGEELVQAQMPIRPGESADAACARLEQVLDKSFEGWRERVTFRRRQVMNGRTGALDLPGSTWRDRPAVDRGDGVFLCGDQVAAPGCLAEVSFASAFEAGGMAVAATRPQALRAA